MSLPDGTNVQLESEYFRFLEANFYKKSISSINEIQANTFSGLEEYINSNVVVQGGLSHFDGFESQVKDSVLGGSKGAELRTADEKQYNSWLGGSVYATLDFPGNFWISKADYREFGRNVLFRKIIN